jgi:hypothetical protein
MAPSNQDIERLKVASGKAIAIYKNTKSILLARTLFAAECDAMRIDRNTDTAMFWHGVEHALCFF